MTTIAAPPTFDEINRNAQQYPAYLLPEHGTSLCLFAAGFHGWNDVIHMVRKDMRVTCVDVNADKLWEMASIYPEGCEFHVDDAWDFAEVAKMTGRQWDAVSVDPFFEDAAAKAGASLDLWASLARKVVTLTVHADPDLSIPDGWTAGYFPRGHDVGWLVLRRD